MDDKTLKEMKARAADLEARIELGEALYSESLAPDASTSDRIKWEICQKICHVYNETGEDLSKMAKIIGCEIIQAKLMIHSHYKAFSMEALVEALDKLRNSDLVDEKIIKYIR